MYQKLRYIIFLDKEELKLKQNVFRKTEYYLYNYCKINEIIEEIKQDIIDAVNISGSAWLRGKSSSSNTVENQAIRLADNKKIYYLKKAKVIIGHYLKIFKERNPKRYKFIKMKYFDKASPIEIKRVLGYNDKQQTDITNTVVSFFYRQFKKAGIGGM